MASTLRWAACGLVLASLVRAQEPSQLYTTTRDQLDVGKLVLAQEKAWNAGDLDGYLAFFKDAPETEALFATPVRGIENVRAAFRQAFPTRERMGTLEQSALEVRKLGEGHAMASGRYHLSRAKKFGGDADGNFWEILEHRDGRWQIVFATTR